MTIIYLICAFIVAFVITIVTYKSRVALDQKEKQLKEQEELKQKEELEKKKEKEELERKKAEEELIEQRKEAARKREEYIKRMTEEDPLTITDINGNAKDIWRYKQYHGDIVLMAENANVYHSYADCFEHWGSEYFNNFTGWKEVYLKDVRRRGCRLCQYCKKRDDPDFDDDDQDYSLYD